MTKTPEGFTIRRSTLLLLLAADLALLGYGVFSRPDQLEQVQTILDPLGGVSLFRPTATESVGTLLVRLDREGEPTDSSLLASLPSGAIARLGTELCLISSGGVHTLRERIGPTDENVAPFEVARFIEYPFDFVVDDAATVGTEIFLVGHTNDGRPAARWFDGFEALPVPGMETGPTGVREVAVAALAGGDRVGVAVRSSTGVQFGWSEKEGAVEWLPEVPIAGVGRDIRIVGESEAWTIVATADDELVALRASTESLRFVGPFAKFPADANLLEARDHDWGISALVDLGGTYRAYQLDGEPATLPRSISSWTRLHFHFRIPMGLHLLLLVMVGMLGRHPLARKLKAPPGREESDPIARFTLAPLGQRSLAFLVDLIVASLPAFAYLIYSVGIVDLEAGLRAPRSLQALHTWYDFSYLVVWGLTTLFCLLEGARGQSIGKSLFGLRVVQIDGSPLSLPASATRALFLLVDFVHLGPLVGITFSLFTRRRQRLGDLIAGTVVVMDKKPTVTPVQVSSKVT